MDQNVAQVINLCKRKNSGEIYLCLKPGIDDQTETVAHLYAAGGKMCYFNVPNGNGFKICNKEYEKYSYGELEFATGRGFRYLFANWDNMIKTCYNRAYDEENFKKGKVSGKKPVNHYERMRENMIAAYNSTFDDDLLAVIDVEYSVDKSKLENKKITKNPKADFICVAVENGKFVFYITEYKSTNNGFGVSLQEHFDDMTKYYSDIKVKGHLIKILQERVKYGLTECESEVANTVLDLTMSDIEVRLLFLFSNASEFEKDKKNILNAGYKYIYHESCEKAIPVKYACIGKIEKECLKKILLRDFEKNGRFELF